MKVNIWIKKEEVIQLEDNKTAKFTKEFGFQTDTDCNYTVSIDGPGIEYGNKT